MGLADGIAWEKEHKIDETNRLGVEYKESCRKELKKDLNKMINSFVDDDKLDNEYKEKVISVIITLLTLK